MLSLTLYSKTPNFLHNTSWILLNNLHQQQNTSLHSVAYLDHDHLHIVTNPILHMKTYILAIRLSTRHNFTYRICSAPFLLKIFINDFNRRTNRKNNLQIKNHKIKKHLMTLHLLLRLRYEILKRKKRIDLLLKQHINYSYHKRHLNLNNHLNLYLILNYQIHLFSIISINSNSRIKSYKFKTNFFLIEIIILLTHFKLIMLYRDLMRRQTST